MRFKFVDGSQSHHCCFTETVVDTTSPVMIGGEQYRGQVEPLCETWEEKDARLIVNSLNLMDTVLKMNRALIDYTNHRGERRAREITPLGTVRWGSTQWHPTPGFLLLAIDMDDGVTKEFAMKDIHKWEDKVPEEPIASVP